MEFYEISKENITMNGLSIFFVNIRSKDYWFKYNLLLKYTAYISSSNGLMSSCDQLIYIYHYYTRIRAGIDHDISSHITISTPRSCDKISLYIYTRFNIYVVQFHSAHKLETKVLGYRTINYYSREYSRKKIRSK